MVFFYRKREEVPSSFIIFKDICGRGNRHQNPAHPPLFVSRTLQPTTLFILIQSFVGIQQCALINGCTQIWENLLVKIPLSFCWPLPISERRKKTPITTEWMDEWMNVWMGEWMNGLWDKFLSFVKNGKRHICALRIHCTYDALANTNFLNAKKGHGCKSSAP